MKSSIFLIAALLLFLSSCSYNDTDYKPQEGDILFQDLECGPLCDAIKQVTLGKDSAQFSHIGLVQNIKGKWMVLESISSGVQHTNINDFLNRSLDVNGQSKIWVGRLQPDYRWIIPKVKAKTKAYLNMPYDEVFIINNKKYYCSELLYDIFKEANNGQAFFDLEPMTFKDPFNGEFLPVWIEYYDKLNTPIPQGELGINPAGISRSPKIDIVRKLGVVSRLGIER